MATKNIVPNDNGEGGIGVTGKRWNTGFINTITGNLTGDVTGNVSGTAATVTGAAQSNITSLGTLTGLNVTGAATFNDSVTLNGSRYLVQRSNDDSTIAFANNASGTPSSHVWAVGLNFSNSNAFTIAYGSGGIPSLESSKLVMTTSGNVGIGATSPTGKITSEATGNHLHLRASTATAGKYWNLDVTSANQLFIINNSSVGINITDSGNVGIGTDSPTSKLHIVDSNNGGAVKVSGAVTDSSASYYAFLSDAIDLQGTTQVNMFYSGGAIKASTTIADFASFRIEGPSLSASGSAITNNYGIYQASTAQKNYFGGKIGIGQIAPGAQLEVVAQSDTVGGDGIILGNGGNREWMTRFGTNTDLSYNLDFYDGSSWSNRFKLSYTGNATFDGSVSAVRLFSASGGNKTNPMIAPSDDQDTGIFFPSANTMAFSAGNTETFRITSGNLIVGATSDVTGTHYFNKPVSADGGILFVGSSTTERFSLVVNGSDIGYNDSPDTCLKVGGTSSTSRSISAAGTVNVSGNDYAEYMTKAITEDISKGDVVGVNSDGLLTNIFNDAISFVIKSTDPSFVGGDIWGIESKDKDKIEEARIKVDRIAFSGQVPCNVKGASVGDYIIPVASSDGKITGQAVSNPTFEQYKISVGKVWKIMNNGNSWVAVKIG
jgi:hypothetical protein